MSKELFQLLDEKLAHEARKHGVPGAVVGLSVDGEEHFVSWGVTSADDPAEIGPDCIFRLASLTKPFVATAAMRLVHLGALELDVPVRQYLPELRLQSEEAASSLTLHHLLTHTGGWLDDPLMEIEDPSENPDALARLPQLAPVGAAWSYSTTGFFLIGRLIERASKKPFEIAIRDLVLNPLGLERTGVAAEDAVTRRVAVGHDRVGASIQVVRPWPPRRWDVAAQGMYSTASDLIRFARFHLSELIPGGAGDNLLSPELVAHMRGPFSDDGTRGLGWFVKDVEGTQIVGHPGGLFGYASDLAIVPERRFAVVVLCNLGSHALDRGIIPWILHRFIGLHSRDRVPLTVHASGLSAYAGLYAGMSRDLEVAVDDGCLEVRALRGLDRANDGVARPSESQPLRLGFFAPERVVVLDGPRRGEEGCFHRDADGTVLLFRFPNFLHVRQPSRIALPHVRQRQQMPTVNWLGDVDL